MKEFSPTKMEWSPQLTEQLIEMYKDCQCLWNTTHKWYRERNKRECTYQRIATSFNTSSLEIKRKIHNLRNQFNQETIKYKKKPKDNDGELQIPRWTYYDSLKFIKTGQATNIIPSDSKKIIHENFEIYESSIPQLDDDAVSFEEGKSPNIESENDEDLLNIMKNGKRILLSDGGIMELPQTTNSTTTATTSNKRPRSKRIKLNMSNNSVDSGQTDRQIQQQQQKIVENDTTDEGGVSMLNTSNSNVQPMDEWTIFGQFVTNELRSLKNKKNRKRLKRLIQKAILDVAETEDDSD